MAMTPSNAIKEQCRYCLPSNWTSCDSMACNLNNKQLSSLKRIRAHCLDCVGTHPEVSSCTGNALYPASHKCSLWVYRAGKNPSLKGKGGDISKLRPFPKKD